MGCRRNEREGENGNGTWGMKGDEGGEYVGVRISCALDYPRFVQAERLAGTRAHAHAHANAKTEGTAHDRARDKRATRTRMKYEDKALATRPETKET